MGYSPEQIEDLYCEHLSTVDALNDLHLQCIVEGQAISHPLVREHIFHGAGRRIMVLGRTIENIYNLFPPSTTTPLHRETLSDVQINLHAFVMNLYGVFENWAWAYYYRHELHSVISDRRKVGMFSPSMNPFLPYELRSYLASDEITRWQREYLKNYRDALAHRIPLYIPPANYTHEEFERYSELESSKVDALRAGDLNRFDDINDEQNSIGVASVMFLHSFTEDNDIKPVMLHPQILSDSKTVVEIGTRFLANWHSKPDPAASRRA